MRIVFMGTPGFAVPSLKKLIDTGRNVVAVVTQPDKASGRGNKLTPPPVKELALKSGLPVLQYNKIRAEGVTDLKALAPDLVVTAAYGQILSQEILDIPKYGVINVHASLLPKYRGSAPIQWAVINGDEYAGVTIMKTALAVDSGDMLLQKKIKIGEKESAGELFDRLAELGADALIEAIGLIERGAAVYIPQNDAEATHCKMLTKEDGLLDFKKTAGELDCFVRGVTPWPSAYYILDGKKFKVQELSAAEGSGKAGEVLTADVKHGLTVAVTDGAVEITVLQAEGGKAMPAGAYLLGHAIPVGAILEGKE